MGRRVRYVGTILKDLANREGTIVDEVRSYWLVRWDDSHGGYQAIRKENVEFLS